jgi:hypothetical protein
MEIRSPTKTPVNFRPNAETRFSIGCQIAFRLTADGRFPQMENE